MACALLCLGDGRQRSQRGYSRMPLGASPGDRAKLTAGGRPFPVRINIDYDPTSAEQD